MMERHTPVAWYATNAGNDYQGLILDEKTGASVAVTYDRCHAPLIAAAPALYEALKAAYVALSESDEWQDMGEDADNLSEKIREAIALAESEVE